MSELHGQLPLFEDLHAVAITEVGGKRMYRTSPKVTDYIPWVEIDADEICEECGTACTSSKECVEISGLYEEEQNDVP